MLEGCFDFGKAKKMHMNSLEMVNQRRVVLSVMESCGFVVDPGGGPSFIFPWESDLRPTPPPSGIHQADHGVLRAKRAEIVYCFLLN